MINSRVKIYPNFYDFLLFIYRLIVPLGSKHIESVTLALQSETSRKYCTHTFNARAAIYLMLKHGLPSGSNVAVTAFTLSDVINMIICAGHKPVFVDIEPQTGNMDEQVIF